MRPQQQRMSVESLHIGSGRAATWMASPNTQKEITLVIVLGVGTEIKS